MLKEGQINFDSLENYDSPWVVGDFLPSILRTKDFEVAIFDFKADTITPVHKHMECVEINIIISGECLVYNNGIKHKLKDGDIFTFPKGVYSRCHYLKDTKLVCIKTPSVPHDKVYLNNESDEG
jgi:quercetin dioxygenase-like cupin family protein